MRILFLLFVMLSSAAFSQTDFDLSEWSSSDINKANTAKDADYLNEEEKEVFFLCNLARINGSKFLKTVVAEYYKNVDQVPNSWTRSLPKSLKKVKNYDMILPQKDLYKVAKDHAVKMGKKGAIGHNGFTKRYKAVMNSYLQLGENCDYGRAKGSDIFFSLFLDEDIANLGHRINILKPGHNAMGVAIAPHTKWKVNAVMSFGESPK